TYLFPHPAADRLRTVAAATAEPVRLDIREERPVLRKLLHILQEPFSDQSAMKGDNSFRSFVQLQSRSSFSIFEPDMKTMHIADKSDVACRRTADLLQPGAGETHEPRHPPFVSLVLVPRCEQNPLGFIVGKAPTLALPLHFDGNAADRVGGDFLIPLSPAEQRRRDCQVVLHRGDAQPA